MAAPRSTGYFRLHAQDTTFLSDASIVPPVPGFQGYTPSMSPQLHAAVTLVNTGPATGMSKPTVGLGAAGAPLIGEVVTVHPDGATVVQDEGYLYLPMNATTPPILNGYVVVDGTGKVQASASNAPTKAICVGYDLDPHVLGNATPTIMAIVKI